MCKYSLEAYAVRNAVEGETLVANQHSARHHGVLTQQGTRYDGTLSCVRDGQMLTIEKVQYAPGLATQIIHSYGVSDAVLKHEGKRIVGELVDGRGNVYGLDCIRLKTRTLIPLMILAPGTEVYVGVKEKKRTLIEKLNLDAKTLRGVAADTAQVDPKPKPDDDDTKEGEQEKEEEKEKKPEEARAIARRALDMVAREIFTPFEVMTIRRR